MIFTSTGISSKPVDKISTKSNKKPVKSVTNAVISYLHNQDVTGESVTGRQIKTGAH